MRDFGERDQENDGLSQLHYETCDGERWEVDRILVSFLYVRGAHFPCLHWWRRRELHEEGC